MNSKTVLFWFTGLSGYKNNFNYGCFFEDPGKNACCTTWKIVKHDNKYWVFLDSENKYSIENTWFARDFLRIVAKKNSLKPYSY